MLRAAMKFPARIVQINQHVKNAISAPDAKSEIRYGWSSSEFWFSVIVRFGPQDVARQARDLLLGQQWPLGQDQAAGKSDARRLGTGLDHVAFHVLWRGEDFEGLSTEEILDRWKMTKRPGHDALYTSSRECSSHHD